MMFIIFFKIKFCIVQKQKKMNKKIAHLVYNKYERRKIYCLLVCLYLELYSILLCQKKKHL